MSDLAATATRLRQVRLATRRFLTLWALDRAVARDPVLAAPGWRVAGGDAGDAAAPRADDSAAGNGSCLSRGPRMDD